MQIKIALTNLGKYNEGELLYTWLDLPATEDEIHEALAEIKLGTISEDGEYTHGYIERDEHGNEYHYEEHFITDYEAPFEIGEYDSLDRLNEMAEALEDLDDNEQEVLEALLEEHTNDWAEALEIVQNNEYIVLDDCADMSDVAYYYVNESGIYDTDNMGTLASYINYEAFGRDLGLEGTFIQMDGNTMIELTR